MTPSCRSCRAEYGLSPRGWDGSSSDVSRVADRRGAAEAAVHLALSERLREAGSVELTSSTPFIEAGEAWLTLIERSDSGKSPRTVEQYRRAFYAYVDVAGSTLRGLTLGQANSPQRLHSYLTRVADNHGTGSQKLAKTVVSGILNLALENGVLDMNAARQVRPIKSQNPRKPKRDHRRALTETEAGELIKLVDERARQVGMDPRTVRKRRDFADLVGFMLGTGVRVSEARMLRWDHVDLVTTRVEIHGTKTRASRRVVNLSRHDLLKRMVLRSERVGTRGLVFASPAFVDDREKAWSLRAVEREFRTVLDAAGFDWAVSHSLRRPVATHLHAKGVLVDAVADLLGHADIRTTQDHYLARDFEGDKSALADLL